MSDGRFAEVHRVFDVERVIGGNLRRGEDLLAFLTGIARRYGVRAGVYSFLGAVSRARVAFYDFKARRYEEIALDEELELVSGTGNVSLLNGEPFVHAHVALSDRQGRMYGGHLNPGTIILAGEFFLWQLRGEPFRRETDPETGLKLWTIANG